MALLAKVLRKKSKAKKDATSNALQKVSKNITLLRIRNNKIEKKIGKYSRTEEERVSSNRRKRPTDLERMRRLEKELEANDEKISKLEIHADALEHEVLFAEVAKTMKVVSEALKNAQTVSTMGMVS